MSLSQPLPPAPNRIAGQPAGVGATTQQQKAFVTSRVEHAIRHQPLLGADEIVVLDNHAAVGQGTPRMEKLPRISFFFVSILSTWGSCRSY